MSFRLSPRLAPLAAVLLLAAPRAAEACAVCGGSTNAQTRTAFILTTIFMTVLPLAAMGSGFWWVRKRLHVLEARADEDRARALARLGLRSAA